MNVAFQAGHASARHDVATTDDFVGTTELLRFKRQLSLEVDTLPTLTRSAQIGTSGRMTTGD